MWSWPLATRTCSHVRRSDLSSKLTTSLCCRAVPLSNCMQSTTVFTVANDDSLAQDCMNKQHLKHLNFTPPLGMRYRKGLLKQSVQGLDTHNTGATQMNTATYIPMLPYSRKIWFETAQMQVLATHSWSGYGCVGMGTPLPILMVMS
jgi:hypothetical protein